MQHLIQDLTFCIGAAWVLGVLAQWLKQPAILAYLIGGFLLGPKGLAWVTDESSIEAISELGLIFLLFMIGLEIDLKKIASAGRTIFVTAGSQILGGTVLGVLTFWGVGFPLGQGHWDALYLGVAAALSSTVIIVKVLYDKRELDTLPGRITLGILVLQDIFAILFLAIQPNLNQLRLGILALSLARVAVLGVVGWGISRYVLPSIFRRVARLPELVLVGAIAWCFLLGELAERLHLSRGMGALVAGITLATFPYALDVAAKVTSLRDFFVTLFFVGLGLKIPVPTGPLLLGSVGLAVFLIMSRFLTVSLPLHRMNQGLRTSLVPAINLCQLSEFSLAVLELGVRAGHIEEKVAGTASVAFVFLAAGSTFGILRSDGMVRWVVPKLKRQGVQDLDTVKTVEIEHDAHGHGQGSRILILGFFRLASSLLTELELHSPDLLRNVAVVDFNPEVHAELKRRGLRVLYGDISQRDTLVHAGIEKAEILVCTIPTSLLKGITNAKLVRSLRELNPTARIIAAAETIPEVAVLYEAGANYVSLGRLEEAVDLQEAVRAAQEGLLDSKRMAQLAVLAGRKEVLP
ncbi:MAG TPA: cation:proton antiporter [Candidatus Limnocylindria bacterium]|jgi:Kef-type K+ transport system membrane component KefB/Trk K+ transport system NAD-binding subunit|nr:cation:proton antiporter [Candidatus Limnocylindria bacterium]